MPARWMHGIMAPGATTGRESHGRAHQQRPAPNGGLVRGFLGQLMHSLRRPGISFAFGEAYDDQLG